MLITDRMNDLMSQSVCTYSLTDTITCHLIFCLLISRQHFPCFTSHFYLISVDCFVLFFSPSKIGSFLLYFTFAHPVHESHVRKCKIPSVLCDLF